MTDELELFFARLAEIFDPPTAERVRATMRAPKRTGYVLNPLVTHEFELLGQPVAQLSGCHSVAAAERDILLMHEAVTVGAVYPINPSSVLAVRQLTFTEATEVLDLAAAPGGKTLLMAVAMGNRGRIAAVEPVKARFHRMRANLARCGVNNVQFYQHDGRRIGKKVPARFDRVLLDAPCSSESRFRLDDPASYAHWKLRKVKESARKQRSLIRSAYAALKPGGELLYCTCAFAPEENEMVVNALLAAESGADLLELEGPLVAGLTEWQGRALDPRLRRAGRILPDDLWDGFFMARIVKSWPG